MLHSPMILAILVLTLASEPDEIVLFDGKSLDGWVAEGVSEFSKDGRTLPVWSVRNEHVGLHREGIRVLAVRPAGVRGLSTCTSNFGWHRAAIVDWEYGPELLIRPAPERPALRSSATRSSCSMTQGNPSPRIRVGRSTATWHRERMQFARQGSGTALT